MEPGDLYKASSSLRVGSKHMGSLRANSSSIWRNTGIEGAANEVDVQNLGFQDKRNLLDRLVNVVDEDNEKFLLKLRNRIDRVGIDLPTIEVRFENLNIEAEAYVGSRALPTFINFNINMIEGILSCVHIGKFQGPSMEEPLKNASGIIKPCRMTLLLGPPSSGKTTLMLALAGKLDPALKVSGRVTYNGQGMEEFVPQRTAAYISQHDLHIGEMTVRETMAFSARCQGVGSRYEMLAELSRREKAANIKPDPDIDIYMKAAATEGDEANVVTDYYLKVLGLDVCVDILVGDEMIRGISGGQKKRVTTGEMLVGPAKALFMDEISTGLDSSTTFQIVKMLRQYVHIMKETAFISLLQPAPETYDLFDDIILLSDGQIVYQGPREQVLDFFESMGFRCPDIKGVADFLQEVTSKKDQQQYWAKDEPYRFVSVGEFTEAYQSFHVGRKVGDELSVTFDKSKGHPAALTTQKYGLGKKELLKACADRELLLMKRNSFVYFFKLFQITVMSLIAMTVFFRTKMHKNDAPDGGIYTGALFFSVVMVMFNGMSELAMTIYKLPVFYKQRDYLFFPAWAYGLPSWILKIPITFLEVAIWTFLTYYVIGFDPNVGRLFKQYMLLLLLHQAASALFRFIGAAGRTMIVANTFGLFALLLLFALGGFVLSREDVKGWWIWGYWASPMMYAQNAILVNEFTGHSWSQLNGTETLGAVVTKSRGGWEKNLNVNYQLVLKPILEVIPNGALLGFVFLFNLFFVLSLTYLNPFEKPQATILEESEDDASSERADANEANQNKKRGMILPFEPHSITFDDVQYPVDMPPEMRAQGDVDDKLVLLKGVSGAFRPGVLTALMGVSGAGKTTLMDVLAGRKTGGYIEGNITISGYPKKQETFARISGYCEQNDIHSPHVTVYESLLYSAWLRLPKEVDAETRKMFIEEVMELVELTPLRGSQVGLPGVNGLSTEQRKRLTIAVELVANPSIIFMDEPTSGLDARAAAIVMRTVRNTVNTGRTVVCTIHQPSIDIFEAFDELFLMKRGGQEIYVGPLGHQSSQLIRFLFTTFIALIFGTMFWDLGSKWNTQQDLFNAMGCMYAAINFLGFQYGSTVQPVVAVERTVFYRERAAGMYSALPYAFAQVLIEVPYVFVQTLVYGLIVYAMMGLDWTAEKFFWFLFFFFFSLMYFVLYGMMTVAVTPNHNIAAIISSFFYAIWNLFSGFIIPRPRIPIWWRWYYWATPVAYTLYGLIVSQFGEIQDVMEDSGDTVEQFLKDYFGFEYSFIGIAAGIILAFDAFRLHFCLFYQGIQLPKEIRLP
ncbi:unnamed protein product [Fraxinus pennsylvanica]|uniref:ABC transporter domain-containing protein n=1 Tax=Fraxinus pennsylvanica TaxID=56036 RepID=A0AAD1ZMX2_9LAMI|nr:unnamed protein product [Fraxinus pennsylvanica]